MKRRLDKRRIEVVDDAVAEALRGKTPAERVGALCRAFSSPEYYLSGDAAGR